MSPTDDVTSHSGANEDSFDAAFPDAATAARIRKIAPRLHSAAAEYWNTIVLGQHLSARMKELILLALHATATAMNAAGVQRHIERARSAGASDVDVLEVLLIIVGIGNHSLYEAVPILMRELEERDSPEATPPPLTPEMEVVKQEFITTRGFFNPERQLIARLAPDYFKALSRVSMEVWRNGSLSPKERELVCIAIDCTVTHMYEAGLRLHIRHALNHGATRDEILAVFQLAALTGLEGYLLAATALAGDRQQPDPA